MTKIKDALMVSALSLGLIVGAVGVVSAATSTDHQQKLTEGGKYNDPIPMVMKNSVAAPAAVPVTVPPKTTASAPSATGQHNQYHYTDGHTNMTPQQHQQMHNMNENHNTNHNENHNTNMAGNHMSGSHFEDE